VKHIRLTTDQSHATRLMYRQLLALSRARRTFNATARALGWPPAHVPELWAAHVETFGHLSGGFYG
jgi:serine/threonine protein phosphatase PrpC